MSYYSDVRLELTRYSFLTLIHYLKNNLPTDAKNPLDYAKIFRDRDNVYHVCWDDVRWDNWSHPELDVLEQGLDYLQDKDCSFSFAKKGEALDDYEHYDCFNEENPLYCEPELIIKFNDYFIKDSVEIDYNSPPSKNTNVEPNIDL